MQNKKTKEETNAQTDFFNTKDTYSSDIYDNDSPIANNRVKLAKLLFFVFSLGILAMGLVLRFVNLPVSLLSGLSPTTWYMIGSAAAVCLQSLFFFAANKKLENGKNGFDNRYLYVASILFGLAAIMGGIVASPFVPAFSHALTDSVVKMSIEYALIAIGALTILSIVFFERHLLIENFKPKATAFIPDYVMGDGKTTPTPSKTKLLEISQHSPSLSRSESDHSQKSPTQTAQLSSRTHIFTRQTQEQTQIQEQKQTQKNDHHGQKSPSIKAGRFIPGVSLFSKSKSVSVTNKSSSIKIKHSQLTY